MSVFGGCLGVGWMVDWLVWVVVCICCFVCLFMFR